MPRLRRSLPCALAGLLAMLFAACGSNQHQAHAGPKHIFVIMMENHGTDQILGNMADAPYINQLASQYGVATNYYGVTHPSLPNYLAAISGDNQGIYDDCKAGADVTCDKDHLEFVKGAPYTGQVLTDDELAKATSQPHLFKTQNIVDQIEASHMTWRAYMQGMPSAGFTGEYAPVSTDPTTGAALPRKLYAEKHNPFMYFADIANTPARTQKIVPFMSFDDDMRQGNVPDFVWISPDQCHDMHGVSAGNAAALGLLDCAFPDAGLDHKVIQLGDTYLSKVVPIIMASPAWTKDSVIAIAWDENDYSGFAGCCKSPVGVNGTVLGGDRAPLLVITGAGSKPMTDATPYNHYSLLATIEHEWKFSCLANTCEQHLLTKQFHP